MKESTKKIIKNEIKKSLKRLKVYNEYVFDEQDKDEVCKICNELEEIYDEI